jgi:putative ABC transport system permease protein
MRLNSINGKKVSEIKADTTTRVKEWILDGQFRATYRDSLISSEQLIEGDWIGKTNNKDLIPISMGVGMKNDGGFKIGDQITFNVQGVFMKTEIKSIRRIEWSQMRMNFAVLFPAGVMEKAPQTNVVTTLAPNDQIAASMQQKLVKAFPNLTIIDLRLVMGVVENILSQIAWVINFLALFSILTGFIVLIGAVRTSKYQRLRENAMLRTIGATSKQIMKMTFVEYALLGFLGVISGVSLSVAGAFLLAKMVFKTQFIISWIPVVVIPIVIIGLVVLIGIVNNLKVIKTSPKEILRS